ncbi:MAG: AAA family ATPase [Clostridium sp.]|uniref:ATP-binding protein n=1 Tax=Clostridium sp. TaxID=1506 RepID=UPI00290FBA16|nr:AAA family ATPase [Clostridium sp.]MDU5109004.1 AAA family ATPase [Clostridium sp.]
MIINKLNIISFGGLKDKVIELTDNVNLIYGENEKGKSTIQNFIRIWLYGMNSKRTKDIKSNDRLRFMPITGEKIRGELYITHNNRSYIISRSFGATKKEDTSEIIDFETGEEILDIPKDEPGRYFFNVNSQTFYKTLFINQLGVLISRDKEEEIIDKAANLLNSDSDNVSVQKALEKLEAIRKSITTPRKTGELDLLRNKLEALNTERYEGYRLSKENIDKEELLISLRERRKETRREINNLDIYKKYIKKVKLRKEYEDITEYLRKKEELKLKEKSIEKSISSRSGIFDEGIIIDIKNENSLYLSLLDMKAEEEGKLKENKEMYSNTMESFKGLSFIDGLTSEEKNKFIKATMEREALKEKIDTFESLNKAIDEIKSDIGNKEKLIGESINFKDVREEIRDVLIKYEEKLKELKFKAESYNNKEEVSSYVGTSKNLTYLAVILVIISALLIIFKVNIFISIGSLVALALVLFKIISLKFNSSSKDNANISIKKLKDEIEDLEREIFKYTKLVSASSYENFIKKLKLFDDYNLYVEKQNLKIREKEAQISVLNIDLAKDNYEINEKYINNMLEASDARDINEVILMFSKYEEVNKEVLALKIDIEKEEKSIEKLSNELSIREKRIREKLDNIGLSDIELSEVEEKLLELKEKLKQREDILKSLESINAAYEALTKDKDIDSIKEELKDIINENINYSYSSEEEIDNQVSIKSNELIEIEKEIKDVENYLNNRFIGKRTIPQIEEEINEVKEKIKKLELLLRSCEIAIENMNETIREVRGNFGSVLNSNVIDYFKKITNNEYSDVMVADSYEMKVRKGKEILPGGALSNGANDQLYLSLRLSFIDMIYKGVEYPLIVDEAFVQYDDFRIERALDMLLSTNFAQLIIFTCQQREENIFNDKKVNFNYIKL